MVFKVQSINRHRMLTDGKGVTTLVGLYGCPLSCRYCINKNVLSRDTYQELSARQLLEKVMIDYCYFLATGGGVTFGGGESLLYTKAIMEFAKVCPTGVSVNLETSLNCDTPDFEELLNTCSHLIIDIKTLDDELYKEYTGRNASVMKARLKAICQNKMQDKCRIRIPLIPSHKTEEKAREEQKIIQEMGFEHVEIFPYIIRDYM